MIGPNCVNNAGPAGALFPAALLSILIGRARGGGAGAFRAELSRRLLLGAGEIAEAGGSTVDEVTLLLTRIGDEWLGVNIVEGEGR